MGLDITAYAQIRKASSKEELTKYGDCEEGFFRLYTNPHFKARADGLNNGLYFAEKSFHFAAGSYGGYNTWREMLAKLAGYPEATEKEDGRKVKSHAAHMWQNPKPGPFMELIHFSDCEGIIGATTAAKLAKDFAQFQKKADAHRDDYFRKKYNEFRKAFELAAQAGCVNFH